jgi:hypothetical protein
MTTSNKKINHLVCVFFTQSLPLEQELQQASYSNDAKRHSYA